MCVAAAIAGAAVVGAAGTAIAGHEAAGQINRSTNAAISEQERALQQQANLSAPYRALGTAAIPQLESLLGLGKGGQAGALATLRATPGYQFQQQQGTAGTLNAASAAGLGLSGNTLQGLSQFNQGLADTTFEQRLQDILAPVGIGQAAAAGQAANIGQAAGNIGNLQVSRGNTLAGIDANTIAGITKSIGSGLDAYTLNNTLAGLGGGGGGNFGFNANPYFAGGGGAGTTLPSGGYVPPDTAG